MAVITDNSAEEHGRSVLEGDRPTDPDLAKLWDIANRGMVRSIENAKLETVAAVPEQPIAVVAESNPTNRSLPLEARLRSAARDLKELDVQGLFDSFPLTPQNEFPTSLTRLPIFRPSQRKKQQSIQDTDNAVAFETPFGAGRRLGPPLTIRDEDTLIAVMRLRDRALTGPESHLPSEIRDIYASKNGQFEVHRVVCTIDQINTELGLTDSGTNFKNTLASVKRLNACKIELDRIRSDGGKVGGTFDLIQVRWLVYERHGLVDIVFPPLMAHWLKRDYTYIDWRIRKNLSALGKATHRYLSGQKNTYAISLNKLAATIGFDGRQEHMKTKFSGACQELVDEGWLVSFHFTGSGRKSPLILHVSR